MTKESIKTGVVSEDDLLMFYDYLNGKLDGNQYILLVTNTRGRVYSTRLIDEDGEDWYILKLLFEKRYKRIKKDSIRSFEVKKFSN